MTIWCKSYLNESTRVNLKIKGRLFYWDTVFFMLYYKENITHTHPFNGPFSGTTRVSWYQKGKTNLDFTEARDSEWQWHQLGHMQVCTSLQTNNHASTPPLIFYRPDALPAAQPTASKHWRQYKENNSVLDICLLRRHICISCVVCYCYWFSLPLLFHCTYSVCSAYTALTGKLVGHASVITSKLYEL